DGIRDKLVTGVQTCALPILDAGIHILGVVGDKEKDVGVTWLGGYAELRTVLDRQAVDHVVLALSHEDQARLGGLLDAVGDEPVKIGRASCRERVGWVWGGGA